VLQQRLQPPADVQLLEQFLLEGDVEGQGEAEDVAECPGRQTALQQPGELVLDLALPGEPARDDFPEPATEVLRGRGAGREGGG
jgi:hypothetical protein